MRLLKTLNKKKIREVALTIIYISIVAVIASFIFAGQLRSAKPLEAMNAGEALNREIQLQAEKQKALDLIEHLDGEILKTREHRNQKHKQEVCKGSGCYLGAFLGQVQAAEPNNKTTNADEELMTTICEKWQIHGYTSPLCNNRGLYHELKNISRTVGVDFGLMVGITFAESHIGANFKPQHCRTTNNRAGKKRNHKKEKDWKDGCWLHQFDSPQTFRYSFAKSLKAGYIDKNCDTPECIARRWVKGDGKLEGKESRIGRVNLFF